MLAKVPGCGAALQIGYVVYLKESKQSCLGVSLHTIDIFGLTSEEVACEMALGVLKRSKANIALLTPGRIPMGMNVYVSPGLHGRLALRFTDGRGFLFLFFFFADSGA